GEAAPGGRLSAKQWEQGGRPWPPRRASPSEWILCSCTTWRGDRIRENALHPASRHGEPQDPRRTRPFQAGPWRRLLSPWHALSAEHWDSDNAWVHPVT